MKLHLTLFISLYQPYFDKFKFIDHSPEQKGKEALSYARQNIRS